jgi:hypothetical protein
MGSLVVNSIDEFDADIPITTQDIIRLAIDQLPTLTAKDVQLDDSCAICLTGFSSILSEEANLKASSDLDRDTAIQLGITKLEGCGHLFCRKESVHLLSSCSNEG